MSTSAATRPYGSWPSPVAAADLASSTRLDDLTNVGASLVWTRSDPDDGRQRLVSWHAEPGLVDLGELDVRSRVHEYGGGAVVTDEAGGDGSVLAVSAPDQRLHRVHPDGRSEPVTPETGATVRFAAGVTCRDRRVVLVRETHDGPVAAQVRNELVLLDPRDGSQQVLVGDRDFVAAPKVGPDGWLAWLAWDHPSMPWDGAELWAGRLVGETLTEVRRVAGGDDVSVAELDWWGADLVLTEDSTGFWELYHHDLSTGTTTRLSEEQADLGHPRWMLGGDELAVVGDAVVLTRTREGVSTLLRADLSRDAHGAVLAEVVEWPTHTGQLLALVPHAGAVATLEVDADGRRAVRVRGLDGSVSTVDEVPGPTTRAGDLGEVRPVTVGEGEQQTHAFLHLPANADVTAPEGSLPPLVVFLHGGPTSATLPVRTPAIAFWTTRGFAVADVNYRGSTGFGRAYRDAMRGRWGEIEVADVLAVATELGRRGLVDADRMAVRGGSAGGFTTLAVLTSPEHPFACGTSFFGVADLAALAADTHKFESRYLDQMVGSLPAAAEVYRERSPLTHVDRLSVPLLVLQGTADKVVPPEQSRVVVDAARAKGLLHDYLLFEGEGHGFRRPENVAAWHTAELAFYRQVMGLPDEDDEDGDGGR